MKISISRRRFLQAGALAVVPPGRHLADGPPLPSKVRTLTQGPKHHFFGYYGIPPWNRAQTRLLCLESDFHDHLPGPDEPAVVGFADARTGRFTALAETRSWNLQQGAMLHWHPRAPDREILYNDRVNGRTVTTVLDVVTRRKRHLPMALAGLSHDGRHALCLSYGRLARLRPVVGYVGDVDPAPGELHPKTDGVFLMNTATGETKLVVSIHDTYQRLVKEHPELEAAPMFFNHTVFNKDDSRFLLLARTLTNGKLQSAMFTARRDGTDLREVVPWGLRVSHFEWRNEREILATYKHRGETRHMLFTDGLQDHRPVGEGLLIGDGHCSFAPDRVWMVTDRNHPETLEKSLWIYNLRTGVGGRVGSFAMKEKRFLGGDLRCDLHPRWSRRGSTICVDALDAVTSTRQLHLIDVRLPANA